VNFVENLTIKRVLSLWERNSDEEPLIFLLFSYFDLDKARFLPKLRVLNFPGNCGGGSGKKKSALTEDVKAPRVLNPGESNM
jgi:hypothetical protein